MNLVIAGGGSGGHLYPGIALAETFLRHEPSCRILFVGTRWGMERRLIPAKGFALATISAAGFVGGGWMKKARALLLIPVGLFQSIAILRRFSPHMVLGVGGYASGPVLLAAILLGIKRALLEPNAVPGMANRWLAPYADLVITAFEETCQKQRVRKVLRLGVPIRPHLTEGDFSTPSFEGTLTLLVMGGSQGAHQINQAMQKAVPILKEAGMAMNIIHQTGERDYKMVLEGYKTGSSSSSSRMSVQVVPFIDNIAEVYAVAHLVLCRAGAITVAELTAIGKPAILVPFPHAEGHQERNAAAVVSGGGAEMILDRDLSGSRLAERLIALLSDRPYLQKMGAAAKQSGHPHAAQEIVKACYQLVGLK